MSPEVEKKPLEEGREKVYSLIEDIKIAMMTTQDRDGSLFSRPMVAQERDGAGDLWFFTAADSPKVREIQENAQILLSYADSDGGAFVSLSGRASLSMDRQKIAALWSEPLKAWFPKGKDDPNICLIRVTPVSAEYWDQPSSKFVQAFGYVKAKITGEAEKMGENRVVAM